MQASPLERAQAKEAMSKNDKGIELEFDVEAEGGLEHWAGLLLEHHLLFPDHEADCLRVQANGAGICSSCEFSAGCYRCYWPKTARYWRNKEMRGKLMEGYMPAANQGCSQRESQGWT